jgi:hypothetical protein
VLGRRLRLFYALLDVEFDRREGLHSWRPLRRARRVLGARAAARRDGRLLIAAGSARRRRLLLARRRARRGLLVYEHSLVRPGDLRRLDTAFFTDERRHQRHVLRFVLSIDVLESTLGTVASRATSAIDERWVPRWRPGGLDSA